MKNIFLFPLLFLFLISVEAQEKRFLSGYVFEDVSVLENIKVVNLTKDITTVTDSGGKYKIAVATGDQIRFSFIGMKTIAIKVEDVTRILNLEMFPEVTELDEVTVQKKKKLSQKELRVEYAFNKNIVMTGFGLLDTKKTIGDIQVLTADDFKANGACLLDLLRLNFTGLRVEGSCALPGPIAIRSAVGQTVIEVDGLIQDPHIIPIEHVRRVAVFAGSALTRKYGADVGGVIVINTFSGTTFGNKIVDRARLRDNFIKSPDLGRQYLNENKRRNQNKKLISGTVTDGKTPIPDVNISIEATNTATRTNDKGKYKIKANPGDEITFSYIGLKTVTIKVEDVTRFLNPVMIPEVTELEEVTVESSKRMSQKDLEEDYNSRKNIIRTAFGYLDGDRAAGKIRVITEEDITSVNLCILDLLRTRFPGITVIGDCLGVGGSVLIRGANSINNVATAIFDVDGQIFTDVPIWINTGNIERVAILNNLALTSTYGSAGSGGVIVINTVAGSPGNKSLVDQARLRNNFINGKILTKADINRNKATYLKELEASTSLEDAKAVFDTYDAQYKSSPYFYLDAYSYFSDKWDELDFADAFIKAKYGLFENNAVLLKALAYQYERQGRYAQANGAYKEIFLLRPNYAQSYMDMANSYRNLNESKDAATIYTRYAYLIEQGFMKQDTVGFGPIMEREFNNLLSLNGEAVVNAKKVKKLYIAEEDFKGTRLVFEWNDSEAEFELQFVNPGNQYYTWKHSLMDNSETIYLEKDFGYNVTEYLLDGSLPGTWSVNLNYLGNKSLTPTYLKATVYYNYGSKSQRKKTKVFKVSLKNVNQELFKVQSVGQLSVE